MPDDPAVRLPPLAGRQQESWRAFIELAPTLGDHCLLRKPGSLRADPSSRHEVCNLVSMGKARGLERYLLEWDDQVPPAITPAAFEDCSALESTRNETHPNRPS